MSTDNFRKHTTANPLQRFLIEAFFKVLVREVKDLNPSTILDVGCGEGFTLERLRKNRVGETLNGVDVNTEAIELGHKIHPQLSLEEGSAYALPYENDTFDVVLCCEVLEHLEHPETAMAEIRRVAKNYCVISVPREPLFRLANFLRGKNLSRWGNDIEHIQHWSARGIANLVKRFFAVNRVRTPFPWTVVVAEKK